MKVMASVGSQISDGYNSFYVLRATVRALSYVLRANCSFHWDFVPVLLEGDSRRMWSFCEE